ncbi:hypothetical protein [Actinoplanes sp. TBRC 11911]|uniref:primosomal protein N' family DNA-binding protein n=1 Tax=Actinoplanes sp. TBRC 11911 TaxID=2729386 RepID=UPI0020071739|nr:hypothetical protein [Actinoplanes sp. TBRC 11911]
MTTTKSTRTPREPATRLPVARVSVDVPLPHLDRPFDYLVSTADDAIARPGVRVKVRFAGQLVSGFLLERAESSPHDGKLAFLDKVVSPEQVLDPEIARLARAMADRYAGNLCDVLRLAVPPRHARVEAEAPKQPAAPDLDTRAAAAPDPLAPTDPHTTAATAHDQLSPAGPETGAATTRNTIASTDLATAHTRTTTEPHTHAATTPSTAPHTAAVDGRGQFTATDPDTPTTPDTPAATDPHTPATTAPDQPSATGPETAAATSRDTFPSTDPHTLAVAAPDTPPPTDSHTPAATTPGTPAPTDPRTPAVGTPDQLHAPAATTRDTPAPTDPRTPAVGTPDQLHAPAATTRDALATTDPRTPAVGTPDQLHAPAATTRDTPAPTDLAAAAHTHTATDRRTRGATTREALASTDLHTPAVDGRDQLTAPDPARPAVVANSLTARDAHAPVPGEHPTAAAPGSEVDSEASLDFSGWARYRSGGAYLRALSEGRPARAVWAALPGEEWATRIAEAAAATVRAGRGVVIVVADARDLDRVDRALAAVLGPGQHVALNAALGPAERYRRFLAASRHRVPVVAGTRAAMWAPVAKLGLVVIWDDGDDLHGEPRSPYPHAREVLLTRAQLADAAALVAGYARTGEGQLLLETGWAKEIAAARDVLRARMPAIAPTGDDPQLARDPGAATARLPSLAWQTARQALQAGAPVLVQVPRRGYLPSVACAECRTPARCPHCSGPLGLAGARAVPTCHWCGRAAADYACPACGNRRLRASVTGARRTAEELGRAFPGATVRTSGRDEILETVPDEAAVVVATPGAEPVAIGGYGAVLLLDTWALLTRADLRAAEETMRRWLNAAALARPSREGGRVVVVADGGLASVQALLRWDPGWFAARELAERRELGFPPAARFASVTGTTAAVSELLDAARLPADAELLGPVPAQDDQERMLIRVPRSRAAAMAHALHEASAVRSARKSTAAARVEVDPTALF